MKPIRTDRLVLRNWEERDRDLFHRVNSDADVMAFYDFRRDRAESDSFMDALRLTLAERGYGFGAVEIAATRETIGFVGINPVEIPPYLPRGTTEIGWRLAPEHWGRGYVTEAARAWLAVAFEQLDVEAVVAFAVWNNRRSTAVMGRLGMRRNIAADFDHPRVVEPSLRRHVLYRLTRREWQAANAAA
jgi:RimJ/RimL family protein N-acetyltransferase